MRKAYEHMEEVWGLESNPFPSNPMHQESSPFSAEVYPEEYADFKDRLIFGAIMDRRGFSYLWSEGHRGEDTGFGKTAMMKECAGEINRDFGKTVLREAGMSETRLTDRATVAAYTAVDTTNSTGLYPVLFSAAEYLAHPGRADGEGSVTEALVHRLCTRNELDPADRVSVMNAIVSARRKLGPTLPPLRGEALVALADPTPGAFAAYLSTVKAATRIRNGLEHFDLVYTLARAAGIPEFFVFIDQLEDLATNPTITRAKREREVGRLRDVFLEDSYYHGHVHLVLTMHVRAEAALRTPWSMSRLPSFDHNAEANAGSIVVLRGLSDTDQVRELVVTYLDAARMDGRRGDIEPLEQGALEVLLEHASGRVGEILKDAQKVLQRAAEKGLKRISGDFTAATLQGQLDVGSLSTVATRKPVPAARDARTLDDLLQ